VLQAGIQCLFSVAKKGAGFPITTFRQKDGGRVGNDTHLELVSVDKERATKLIEESRKPLPLRLLRQKKNRLAMTSGFVSSIFKNQKFTFSRDPECFRDENQKNLHSPFFSNPYFFNFV
jgi:hypothetical protein